MKSWIAAGMVGGMCLVGVGEAAELVREQTETEQAGPRAGQLRSFGWQERERMTASSYDYSQLQGEGTAAGDASADAAAEAAAAATGTSGEGEGEGTSND